MRCPECSADLKKNATSCACGWNQGKINHDRPPLVEDELMKIIGAYMARKPIPEFMPPAPIDAARWWMDQQEPAGPDDKPRQVSIVGDDDNRRWICPYHLRVCETLKRFLSLPLKDQRIILAAREDGIYWRGDEMYFFMLVIAETEKMRKVGVSAYRDESINKLKNFVRQTKKYA